MRLRSDTSPGVRSKRDEGYGQGTGLRGVDLVERIASNTRIQKRRWVDIYRRLWERKAKIDVADAILISDGSPQEWFFTSPATGEIERKSESQLTSIAIKKHIVRAAEPTAVARHVAILFHENVDGDVTCALLNDLDFNLVLCQPGSPLWASSFLLQPHLPSARQHPHIPGAIVAKFNASTSSSVRVVHCSTPFYDLRRTSVASTDFSQSRVGQPSTSTSVHSSRATGPVLPRGVEELIRKETLRLVGEIEAATRDALRQLHAEFQITRSHRLVLIRLSRIVYASDLQHKSGAAASTRNTHKTSTHRKEATANKQCAGGRFCHCKAFATGEINKTNTALSKSKDLQQITRKSLQLCDEESAFLDGFGANAEAHLETQVSLCDQKADSQDAYEAFKRVLQRRVFMLRSTLWNPESTSFNAKPLAWEDETKRQSQQYEMVRVCRACYLIYHAMDAERFQATKSTVKAAARRLTMLHNAKMMEHGMRRGRRRPLQVAWEPNDDIGARTGSDDDDPDADANALATPRDQKTIRREA